MLQRMAASNQPKVYYGQQECRHIAGRHVICVQVSILRNTIAAHWNSIYYKDWVKKIGQS